MRADHDPEPAAPAATDGPRLPLALTSFVGRGEYLTRLRSLIREHRLLTLVGPGGVGKSRLVREFGRTAPAPVVVEGLWIVDLSSTGRGEGPAEAVRAALGLSGRGPAMGQLEAFCADRAMVLVLDNCEHLVAECRELVVALLGAAPRLHILTSSRQALGIFGEQVVPLGPLSLPGVEIERWRRDGTAAEARTWEAVQLFEDRARSTGIAFVLDDDTAGDVIEICVRLDGLPLAIELAAARLPFTGRRELLDRLEDRFALLTQGDPSGRAQHRSLEAMMQWSFELCGVRARDLWSRFSVFGGGADLAAIEAVCGPGLVSGQDDSGLLDAVRELVAQSLLVALPTADGMRYQMLETTTAFGRNRLSGEASDGLRRRHAAYYADLVRDYETGFLGSDQATWVGVLRVERSNVATALGHLVASDDPEERRRAVVVVASLWFHWITGSVADSGLRWIDEALRGHPTPDGARAWGLACRAVLTTMGRSVAPGDIAEALMILDTLGDDEPSTRIRVRVHDLHSLYLTLTGQHDLVEDAYHQARDHAKALAAPPVNPVADLGLTYARLMLRVPGAGETARAAAAAYEAESDSFHGSLACFLVALDGRQNQRVESTEQYGARSVELGLLSGNLISSAMSLLLIAEAAMLQGRHERSVELLGAAEGLADETGSMIDFLDVLLAAGDRVRADCATVLGAEGFEEAYDRGRAWPLGQILQHLALALDPQAPDRATRSVLSPRETEVADLVADGATNREIAESLVLSVRTVEGHIERILRKLHFRRRTQIAAWVVRSRDDDRA